MGWRFRLQDAGWRYTCNHQASSQGVLSVGKESLLRNTSQYPQGRKTLSRADVRIFSTHQPHLSWRAESPDVIIAAVGSKPIIPRITDRSGCAQNVYEDPSCVQDQVVVIGGLVGIERHMAGMSGKKYLSSRCASARSI